MDHRSASDLPDAHPLVTALHDAVRPTAGGIPLSAPGARTADHSNQSDTNWFGSGSHFLSHATRGRHYLQNVGAATTGGAYLRHTGTGTRVRAGSSVHVALC